MSDTQVRGPDATTTNVAFTDVPAAEPSATVDPFWLQLRGEELLPTLYMPPTMSGRRPAWMRALATVLIAVFMLATALGICLTYGPPNRLF
jgi:hypothetical protein